MANSITPPPELLREWCAHNSEHENYEQFWHYIAAQAAQWGADQELEACCKLMEYKFMADSGDLRAARRPEPPSLKQQALNVYNRIYDCNQHADFETIRRALEALDD